MLRAYTEKYTVLSLSKAIDIEKKVNMKRSLRIFLLCRTIKLIFSTLKVRDVETSSP